MIDLELHMSQWILLGIFSVGSILLAADTVMKVVRLRNIRLHWKAGKLGGYPLFSTLFMGTTLLALTVALARGELAEVLLAGCYLVMGMSWFVTSYLASKRYITDHGIVKNINELTQTVAWHQIRDLVEKENGTRTHFVFMYVDDEKAVNPNLIRLELAVPHSLIESFRKLISHKLGRRISCYERELFRMEQFD